MLRFSGSLRNFTIELLNATELDLANQIIKRLAGSEERTLSQNSRRLDLLLKSIKATRIKAWNKIDKEWFSQLIELAKLEPEFLAGALSTVSPVVMNSVLPSSTLLKSIVTTRPFLGKVLRQWSNKIAIDDITRINDQINIGLVQGESSKQIARRVVGTARLKGSDGVTEITRRNAAAITRTAVIAISNQAKREFYTANSDVLKNEQYVATLDGRTTPICRSLDGKIFKLGEGPIPPLHFNCRSLRIPVIDGTAIARRPMRRFTEKQLVREFSSKNGLTGRLTSRAKLPRGFKGKFDKFARTRMRELTGTTPGKVTYSEFLSRQTVQFQNDVLGITKATLFRKGGLPLDKFVNRQGKELTLNQLARTEKKAFIDAGLDPEDFL